MKITALAVEPKLIKVVIDDEDTIQEFEEAVEFWCYDRQPIASFVKFANNAQENIEELFAFCEDLILDSKGEKVLVDGKVLPAKLLMKCVNKVVELLGK
jgi:predicted RND superfamily exporter protein